MRKMFLSILIVLFGCSPGPIWHEPKLTPNQNTVTTATVCLELPDAQINAANEAVKEWDRSIYQWRRLVAIRVPANNAYCSYSIKESSSNTDTPIAEASMLGGKDIVLYHGRYEADAKKIIMHELGHCLGAQHVDDTLMNPHWDKDIPDCPDKITVIQVAAFNQINLDMLAWCSVQ